MEEQKLSVPPADYTKDEIDYRSFLLSSLVRSFQLEEQPNDFFDGMTRTKYYEDNERRSSTFLEPRKNRQDTVVSTGVTRQKLFAFASAINNLNLTADITAFDDSDNIISNLGEGMESLVNKSRELDNDEEKQLLRTIELLKHGEVYVEDVVIKRKELRKKLKVKFDGTIPKGEQKLWEERMVNAQPKFTRNIISGLNVYLADPTIYDIQDQPHLFTRRVLSYDDAKSIYGDWERFKNVSKLREDFSPGTSDSSFSQFGRNWSLEQIKEGQVEEVKFQAKFKNEYMILLNGVMMLPIRFPLPWELNIYNIEHQVLEPFSPFFAHGKSLPAKFKSLDSVLDEFLRLMVLKTQQSFMPAVSNMTGRVLSSRVLMPGMMNNGVDSSQIKPMLEGLSKGVTNSEFSMFKEVEALIDNNSVNPQFQGQQARQSGTTATEVLNNQKQAEVMLGTVIFACSMLEKKLTLLRIPNIIQHWFSPIDTKVDEIKNKLVNVYKNVSIQGDVPRKGIGEHIIKFVDNESELQSSQEIYDEENKLEKELGVPVKKFVFNAPRVLEAQQNAKLYWRVVVVSKPKKTSELEQVLFRNMLVDLSMFGPSLNIPELQAEAARVWNKNPAKIFLPRSPESMTAMGVTAPSNGQFTPETIAKKNGIMSAGGGVGSVANTANISNA